MKVELVKYWGNDLEVVNSARVSMDKYKSKFDEKDAKLIKYLITNKHWSPFEHSGFTFLIECPIYVARQIMRHKSFSFSEISGRYVEFEDDFYIPEYFREQDANIKQGSKSVEDSNLDQVYTHDLYKTVLDFVYQQYQQLLYEGVCKEQARGLLPLCTYTKFYATCNLRSLIHYLELRLDSHAQEETRIISQYMLNSILEIPDNPFKYSLSMFDPTVLEN